MVVPAHTPFDFDGDGKADFVVMAADGSWHDVARPNDPPLYVGHSEDRPVAADFDGTGYRPAVIADDGTWVVGSNATAIDWPAPEQLEGFDDRPEMGPYHMLPVPADYDGDGRAQAAWYRDSDGKWFIDGQDPIQFGKGPTATDSRSRPGNDTVDQDLPVPADYDGDGTADLATYNPRSLEWRVRSSRDGSVSSVTMPGSAADLLLPVPGDYDGVGHAQRAGFGLAGWRIEGHDDAITFGLPGNETTRPTGMAYPAPADYDGDGKVDLSYIDNRGTWHTRSSADPDVITTYVIGPIARQGDPLPVAVPPVIFASIARLTLSARNCTLLPTGSGTSDC